MPEWVVAILLGVIEGVTEFLPVSSTGHLLIAQRWLPRQSDLFNIVIQSGTVLAVPVVFAGRLRQMIETQREPATRSHLGKIVSAFFITGFGGLALDKLGLKLPEDVAPVAWATLIGGVFFLLVERWKSGARSGARAAVPVTQEVTWTIAFAIAAAQLVAAAFPGASRSGTTILVALLFGLSRPAAVEFSFLLGVPTLLAAGAWKIYKALRHTAADEWLIILIGSVTAALTAFVVVKWLLRFVQTHTFIAFGWYRVVLGLLLLIWVT
ncbi:MAG: undecaprenyl-diphosphate phosphatase [Pedosphaera sp.]|nr:undecaprenyl-diphosphate phosphatase [Pedosphaera sp.]